MHTITRHHHPHYHTSPTQTMPCPHQVTLCRRNPTNYREHISMDYLLGPADAIVVHMCSPPPSSYFSMDAYLSSRYTAGADPFYPGTNFGKRWT